MPFRPVNMHETKDVNGEKDGQLPEETVGESLQDLDRAAEAAADSILRTM